MLHKAITVVFIRQAVYHYMTTNWLLLQVNLCGYTCFHYYLSRSQVCLILKITEMAYHGGGGSVTCNQKEGHITS